MNRRRFVGAVGIGVTPFTGCTAVSSFQQRGPQTRSITNREFRLVAPDERDDSGDFYGDDPYQHTAAVAFDAEETRVVVTGQLKSQAGSCVEETVLADATYDGDSDTLTVAVSEELDESTDTCTTELSIVPYEATVSFESGLPKAVIVKHQTNGTGAKFEKRFEQA